MSVKGNETLLFQRISSNNGEPNRIIIKPARIDPRDRFIKPLVEEKSKYVEIILQYQDGEYEFIKQYNPSNPVFKGLDVHKLSDILNYLRKVERAFQKAQRYGEVTAGSLLAEVAERMYFISFREVKVDEWEFPLDVEQTTLFAPEEMQRYIDNIIYEEERANVRD